MIFLLNGLFILVFLLPFIPYLVELSDDCKPKAFKKQCSDLFETVQLRAVWQPMTFVYVFNAMQIANAAWMSFLVEGKMVKERCELIFNVLDDEIFKLPSRSTDYGDFHVKT